VLGSLPEPVKAQENLKKFVKIVVDDVRIRGQLLQLVSPDCECKRAEEAVVSCSSCWTDCRSNFFSTAYYFLLLAKSY